MAGLRPIPSGPLAIERRRPASDFTGVGPTGEAIGIQIGAYPQQLLLAFLHTRCDGCEEFWRGFRDDADVGLPPSVSAVIVTQGIETVSADEVAGMAIGVDRVPVVMSGEAWSGYQVMGYPFFILIDGSTNTVVAETVGFGWPDVVSMIQEAGC